MKGQKTKPAIRLTQIDCRHDEKCELRLVDGPQPYIWIGSEDRGLYGLVPDSSLEQLKKMVDKVVATRAANPPVSPVIVDPEVYK